LDGGDRWLETTLRQRPREPLIALAIAATGTLAHLPWEVLHNGQHFLVAQRRPTVVPLRWCCADPNDPVPVKLAAQAQNRALNLLFMATAPAGVQPELKFEEEEARILTATAKQPLALQVEESGCLEDLADLYGSYPAGTFDGVHLTGHANHDEAGPIFLTETAVGEPHLATVDELVDVFGFHWPPLVFLSGCRTGERMQRGTVPSLAEGLIGAGAQAVLGWGRPVLDRDGTAAAAALYGALAAGKPLLEAIALTVQALLKEQARDWHLLRLHVADQLPGALVTPLRTSGRQRAPHPSSASTFLDPETRTIKVATRQSFVGRRRSLQHCLKSLRDPSGEHLGVVITGFGGYGKSSLAARICDRLPDFDRQVWIGPVDEPALVSKLAAGLDDPALRQRITDDGEELRYRLRGVFQALAAQGAGKLLLVLDDFEQNLEADCATLQTPVAAWLGDLLWALTESQAPHRLLITCRYEFNRFSGWGRLFHQPIAQFAGGDWQKKCAQLAAFQSGSVVPEAMRERALALADGNPRLLEWLDKVLRGEVGARSQEPGVRIAAGQGAGDVDVAAVLDALEQNPVELRERVLAQTLLAQMDAPMRELLQRGRVFELPVPLAALREICGEAPGLERYLARAVALGLLETDRPEPDLSQPDLPVRVPRVLPLEPVTDTALAAQAARVLYRMWWEAAESSTEAQHLEIHRLALAGKVGDVAATVGNAIARNWKDRSRFREGVKLCRATLETVQDYRILHQLARCYAPLGEVQTAREFYEKALDCCDDADECGKSEIIHNIAVLKADQGDVAAAIPLYHQALEINERIGNEPGTAATLHEIGRLKAHEGEVEAAITLYRRSLEINERIGNIGGVSATLGQMAKIFETQGDTAKALSIYQEILEVTRQIGNAQHESTFLHQIAGIRAQQGEIDEGIALYEQSLEINERIGNLRGISATLHAMGRLKLKQGDVDAALALFQQSVDIKERIGDAQGKAATLHEMGRLKLKQGEVYKAVALFQKSLNIQERIGDVQGRAITLQWIGGLAAHVSHDYETGIRCFQESLEILERIGSPEAANARAQLERIQAMALQ
jgi:tetratricopeptide (TPR) repeat protein